MPTVRRFGFALLAVLLCAPQPVAAQPAPSLAPARLARIDTWVQGLIAQGKIPGAVVLLVKDGRVAYEKAWGVRDLSTRAPLRPDDLFRLASQTKAVTSVAAMMLWEEGRFGLDEPVGKYLPAFAKSTVLTRFNAADSSWEARPARGRITIRQLLTHTSGLDYADIGSADFRAIYAKAGISALGLGRASLAADMDKLGTLPLRAEPGERFIYSLSVDVLGRLVEVLSGQTLEEFFATRIFGPLKMRDTHFRVPPAKAARLVGLPEEVDGRLRPQPARGPSDAASPDYPLRPMTYFAGGAGLTGTTRDYARFLQMVLNGGELDGVRLLGRATVQMMLTNQVGALGDFGLGFGLETPANDHKSPLSVGSFQWGGAFRTTYWADPRERLVALLYTNVQNGSTELGDPFKALVYQALR